MTGRRRLAFFISELDSGGAERALVRIASGLGARDWDVTVISLTDRGPLAVELEQAGITVEAAGLKRSLNPVNGCRAIARLIHLLKQHRPDLVQTFLWHANIAGRIASRLAGIQHVVSGIRVAEHRSLLRLKLDRWTERLVDRHVCVSQSVADFSATHSGLDLRKLVVIPNGVDLSACDSIDATSPAEFSIPDGAPVVLCVGRLDRQKDPQLAVRVFRRILDHCPVAHLLVVGSGPLEPILRDQIQQFGLRDSVHLTGWRADVPALMKMARVFLLTSRWEGMPNVILEAGACRLPIVSTDVEGVREIISHGQTGLITPIGDESALVSATLSCLQSPAAAADRALRLRSVIESKFTWQRVIDQYESLYRTLLGD